MFLISVNEERSRSGKWWNRGGAGAEWLLNAWSAEEKLLMLHSAHILCRTPPHKCGFLLMTVLLQDLTQSNSSLPVTKYTVTVCYTGKSSSIFHQFLKLSFDYVLARHLVAKIFFGPMPNLLADPWFKSYQLNLVIHNLTCPTVHS